MKVSNLRNLFNKSFKDFVLKERNELLHGTNERSMCTRLGIYLHDNLLHFGVKGYYIDTDYNRKQNGEVKTIIGQREEVIKIYADLIIHSRGEKVQQDNLIAIEMKKSYRTDKQKNDDRNRLIAMTKDTYDNVWSYDGITHPEHVCRYSLGIYIEINKEDMICLVEYYEKGRQIEAENFNL